MTTYIHECRTCKFSKFSEDGGECRKHSPTVSVRIVGSAHYPLKVFPPIEKNDWCGDYEFDSGK